MVSASFWNGKRVLITGHTGFKGIWFSAWLSQMSAKLTGIALDPVTGSLYNGALFENDIRADICDKNAVRRAFELSRPEIVFHLAAQAFVAPSLDAPALTYATNVVGLANVLESVRVYPGVRGVVVVTSDKAYYGECGDDGFREDQAVFGGLEPYSGSKACQEIVVQSFCNAFSDMPPVATARASNVVGGGDPFRNRLIPAMLEAFSRGEPAQLRNPLAIRPWQNVLDCLRGYLTLAQKLCEEGNLYSGGWNFGPLPEGIRTVEWIAERMVEYWGDGACYKVTAPGVAVPEKDILRLNITKSISWLGWKPLYTLERTLRQVVAFEKGRLNGIPERELFGRALEQEGIISLKSDLVPKLTTDCKIYLVFFVIYKQTEYYITNIYI